MEETAFDLRAIVGLLRRRIKLIAVTVLVIVGAALLYAFSLTPTFTSSALLLINTRAVDLLDPTVPSGNVSSDNARVDSEVEILKSDNILLDVIDQKNLISDDEFGVKLGWRDQLLARLRIQDAVVPTGSAALQSVLGKLRKSVSIRRRGLTYLISVSATSVSPINAADIANAVANAYIIAQVRAKVDNILISRNVLQARIDSASNAIVFAEQSFDIYIADNIDTITRETGRTDIGDMRNELDRINSANANMVALTDLISQNISLINWVAVSESLQDEALMELQRQRDELNATLLNAAEGSLIAIDLRTELTKIDENLLRSAQSGLSTLKLTVADDQVKASELRQQIRTSVVNSNLPADILAQIYQIQQNSDIARTQYETLISRIRELDVQAQTQIADARIVSKALPPASPSFPNKRLILALAGMSALGLGVGLALLYENILGCQRRFKSDPLGRLNFDPPFRFSSPILAEASDISSAYWAAAADYVWAVSFCCAGTMMPALRLSLRR